MILPDGARVAHPNRGRFWSLACCLPVSLCLMSCNAPGRAINVGAALAQASRTNQIVLVEFWGFQDACSRMDAVLAHPQAQGDLADFIRVRMNYAVSRSAARQMGVTGAPGFAVLRPDGSAIAATTGQMDIDGLRQFLARARIFR
jgi:thioredoxin-like negative regulator of GroEL